MLELRLTAMRYEARGITSFELRLPDGGELPPFSAGAHVDLHLPEGLVRSYSLVGDPDDRRRWRIAVARDRASRGGSRFLHERARVGDVLAVAEPRNNFALDESSAHSVLIAGGIGITPLLAMARRLVALGASWELVYCARDPQCAAFLDELRELSARGGGRLTLNFDHVPGGTVLDVGALVRAASPKAHLYCCGPLSMLEAFEAATAGRRPERVHLEYFSARQPPDTRGGFVVELARSGKTLEVADGTTILETVLDAGIEVPHSCMEGVCASCETRVLEGVPDHRDLVLTRQEREANRTMMICCSGSKSGRLVLDL